MAVNKDNNVGMGQLGNALSAAQEAQQQQQQQFRGNATIEEKFSLSDLSSRFRGPMAADPTAEVLSNLMEAMTESLKSASSDVVIKLVPIDGTTHNLVFSAIVLVMMMKSNPSAGAYHTMILEGSSDELAPTIQSNGQNQLEVKRFAFEAMDSEMCRVIGDTLAREFPGVEMFNADSVVVPRNFSTTNKELVYKLTSNSVRATYTELCMLDPEFKDLNLANASNDSTLQVKTTFGNPDLSDSVGLPVRSDIVIELSSLQLRNQGQGLNNLERTRALARIAGYVDLIWAPATDGNNLFNPQQSFLKFTPRFVVTAIESMFGHSIGAQLLCLLNVYNLYENALWAQTFRNKAIDDRMMDLHDIGGIGYDANFENNPSGYGDKIDSKTAAFQQDFGRMIAMTMRPNLVVSMDVGYSTADSWHTSIFAAAASDNKEIAARAHRALMAAAHQLTNGHITKYFNGNDAIVSDDCNPIHMGYFSDANGELKDLRHIDYLAVANKLGDTNPAAIRDWSDTNLRTEYSANERLAGRARYINAIVHDATYTTLARRLTVNPEFLIGIGMGIKDVGITIRALNNLSDMGGVDRASGSNFNNFGLSGNQSRLFSRDFGNNNAGIGGGNFGMSSMARRWGGNN